MAATSNPPSGEDVAADPLEFYEHPNFTQVPNHFLDTQLAEIDTMAELKVTLAVLRETFGFRRAEKLLSISTLQERTGLARKSVVDGVTRAVARGYIGRRRTKGGFVYGARARSSAPEPAEEEKVQASNQGESSEPEPDASSAPEPGTNKGKKEVKKNSSSAKRELEEKAKRIFEFWLSLDASKNPAEYTFTEKRKKVAIKRLGDSTDQEIADALRGQWHDPWCQNTGKLDMEYALRNRENLEDFRDRRKRQVGTTVAATSNGNGQPSAHPEYDTTWKNPVVEAIRLIDANGPRTANEVAQALGQELEPTREILMGMVEDGDCVYIASQREAGEGTYARPGEAM